MALKICLILVSMLLGLAVIQCTPQHQFPQLYKFDEPKRSGGRCEPGENLPHDGQCDKYLKCGPNGEVEEHTCPDGLVFNPEYSVWRSEFPCYYPQEAKCGQRRQLQPAQATEGCPRQFALFTFEDPRDCAHYVNCAHGQPNVQTCPEGLAFSNFKGHCTWPDEAEYCDAAAYLGFNCPAPTEPGALDYYPGSDCQRFFVCVNGKPRLHVCGEDTVYDPELKTCVKPEESSVPGCSSGRGASVGSSSERLFQQQSSPQFLSSGFQSPARQTRRGSGQTRSSLRPTSLNQLSGESQSFSQAPQFSSQQQHNAGGQRLFQQQQSSRNFARTASRNGGQLRFAGNHISEAVPVLGPDSIEQARRIYFQQQ